jgi:hypothetical protein
MWKPEVNATLISGAGGIDFDTFLPGIVEECVTTNVMFRIVEIYVNRR